MAPVTRFAVALTALVMAPHGEALAADQSELDTAYTSEQIGNTATCKSARTNDTRCSPTS